MAACQIITEIDTQMTDTGEKFDNEVAKIHAAVVNEPNEVGTMLLVVAEKGFINIVVELLKHSDKESLARKNKQDSMLCMSLQRKATEVSTDKHFNTKPLLIGHIFTWDQGSFGPCV